MLTYKITNQFVISNPLDQHFQHPIMKQNSGNKFLKVCKSLGEVKVTTILNNNNWNGGFL